MLVMCNKISIYSLGNCIFNKYFITVKKIAPEDANKVLLSIETQFFYINVKLEMLPDPEMLSSFLIDFRGHPFVTHLNCVYEILMIFMRFSNNVKKWQKQITSQSSR